LTSQWGRDSSFQSGGKRRSGAVTVIAVIISLVLGAAGGYGALRFIEGDSRAAVDAAHMETVEAHDALALAQKELGDVRADLATKSGEIGDLKAVITRQAGELDAMTAKLAASSSSDQASGDGNAAIQAIARERDKLAAENQSLKADLAALGAERDALGKAASADKQRLEAEIARLQTEVVPQLTAERDQLQRKITMMLADQANLKARIKAASDTNDSDAQLIADLQARLAAAERNLEASQAALAAIKAQKTETAASAKAATAADSQQSDPAANSGTQADPASSPRTADAVAAALRSAPGLETLSDDDRRKLTEKLVAGDCVTTALESVFARVPILTLRNLIRDLNSGC
jgi:chromosome segregation ATPase